MKLLSFNKNIIKYFIILCILYYILKLIPSQQINNKDTIIMIVFVLASLIFIDNNLNKVENFQQSDNNITLTSPIIDIQSSTQSPTPIIETQPPTQSPTPIIETQPPIQSIPIINPEHINNIIPLQQTISPEIYNLQQQYKQHLNNNNNNALLFNYFKLLINDLKSIGIINNFDIKNMKLKLDSHLVTLEELISYLEFIKSNNKQENIKQIKDDNIYDELPQNFYKPIGDKIANEWKNDYAILDTDKWAVPTKDPPLCINTSPCKVCESEASDYTSLKNWDNSRYISNYKINKKWINNQ